MSRIEQGGSRRVEGGDVPIDPRAAYVTTRLTATREVPLIEKLGEVEGRKRLGVEIGLLTRVVTYLDTPLSQRGDRKEFVASVREDALAAGLTSREAINLSSRGQNLFEGWLNKRRRQQAQVLFEQNPYMGVGGMDPNVHLQDGSHRRGYQNDR